MGLQNQDAARLQDIAAAFYAERIGRDDARSAAIDVVANRLRCARVSLWKFEGTGEQLTLLCFASKRTGESLETAERRLDVSEYRDYFNALIERGIYASDDAMADPALQPMRENYLVPNNVLSMLDAAFMLNGRTYGTICCEETTAMRHWQAAEIASLRSIVTKLALMMTGADDPELWRTPSLPMRALDASGRQAPVARAGLTRG